MTLEMFERDVQPLLDQYLAGNISEKNFLDGARPWDRYTTDYRPMVELARVHGWPVIAAIAWILILTLERPMETFRARVRAGRHLISRTRAGQADGKIG